MATIVQTETEPLGRVDVDPITLDLIENALRNARYEMDAVLFRTAMSPGIREQGDAFPLIADHEGRMIVGQFGSFIGGFLEGYQGTVAEGRARVRVALEQCRADGRHRGFRNPRSDARR